MLWVSKFGIVDGQAAEESPWVGAFSDDGRSEEPSDLYVIVHPALPGSEEFCADLRDAIGQTFHREKVSLTGGMLRALRDAHEHLRDWNSRSLREHQVGAGASLLAVHGREAYLAQGGPSSAVFYRDFGATVLAPELPESQVPLGAGEEFWPQFRRFDLVDGDRMLLLTPGPAARIGRAGLAQTLELPAEDAVKVLFRMLREAEDEITGAVLIAVEPDPVEETALEPAEAPPRRKTVL